MRIALVFAAASLRRGTRLKHFMVPPHSLQILSALTPDRHQVAIFDEYHRPAPVDMHADLVGISVWTAAAVRAYELADALRARGLPVVLGGPHVTLCPEEAQAHADCIVAGEAEGVWAGLLDDFEQGRMRSRYDGEPLPLSETPDADWHRIPPREYVLNTVVSASRGCTNRCWFCFESSRKGVAFRLRPLPMVLREIRSASPRVVAFIDNDLLADREYAHRLLRALIPMRIQWFGMTTIGAADDEELLDLLAASGCRTLYIGFESVNRHCLDEVRKGWNHIGDYIRNVRRLHDRDIMVNGSFVFGFDHDGPDVFTHTVQFGIEARLETATFTILTPYPGTLLYKKLLAGGRIIDHDWSHYDTTRVVFQPMGMSGEELEAGYFQAYRDFYSWRSIR
ncbi:B12-binding domain-containing radical SAM protein, partial [bacterium]|nr:B12-binding domain-containing radical SAM protein [candidate division CSSED10-310 bacterium]